MRGRVIEYSGLIHPRRPSRVRMVIKTILAFVRRFTLVWRTRDSSSWTRVCSVSLVLRAESPDSHTKFYDFNQYGYCSRPGIAHYPMGNYESAIADLTESSKVFPFRAWDWLFLAIANHKVRNEQAAKRCLKKATEWIDLANQNRP